MWTKQDLQNLIKEKMGDYLFVVVSNRQPYEHIYKKGKVYCQRGTGGVISALDPVMQACGGIWVAYGNGDADPKVSDERGRIKVPPDNPSYTLKRVWLSREEEIGYYHGFSNEALWPLCHFVFQRPVLRQEDWDTYKKVNAKFAQALLEEIGNRKAFVWIQDYHFCLLPKYLKQLAPSQLVLAHFWHIPWPSYEAFRICPQKTEILEGLLSNDLLGFHTRYHCNSFLDVIDRELESKIDRERFSILRADHETIVRPYPISVDFNAIDEISTSESVSRAKQSLIEEFTLSDKKVIIGVDRIDYTKGIPERLAVVDHLLGKHPELKEKIVFLQIGVISRIHIEKYKQINDEINALVENINWKHSTGSWDPIIMARRHLTYHELIALYRLGDVCVVSSLHDGMNLVAKEFVSSRSDGGGMLVLSQFTGAARELTGAIMINPYDQNQFSDSLFYALTIPEEERSKRMTKMREVVKQNNIYRWAGKVISELLRFEFKE